MIMFMLGSWADIYGKNVAFPHVPRTERYDSEKVQQES